MASPASRRAESLAANSPKEPLIKIPESANATYNDPALAKRVGAAVARVVGEQNFSEWHPEMVAEDFGTLCKAAGSPYVQLRIGAVQPAKFEQAMATHATLPSLHSSGFAPDREPTIRTGVITLVAASLELLDKPIVQR